MTEPDNETQALIERIRSRSGADNAFAGAITLFNLIPYAGGAVASVVGEFASQRKFEKVCEVLSDLNATLEAHKANPEEHLSKDQVVEVVNETLQTAATTSDGKKLDALKRGLGYAFLADDPFERKQVFLQVLRGATALELVVLQKIYEVGDPHVVTEGGPVYGPHGLEPSLSLTGGGAVQPAQHLYASAVSVANGVWQPVKNEERGAGTLLSFLARQTDLDEGMVEGVLRLLDSKGLTSATANLQRTDSKVMKWIPVEGGRSLSVVAPTSGYSFDVVKPSPLEATRTKFGAEFLRICKSGVS